MKKFEADPKYLMLNLYKPPYAPWRYPSNWFRNIRLFFRGFRWRRQRARYGFCEADLWDLHSFLSELIATALHNFPKDLNSMPTRYYRHDDTIENAQEVEDEGLKKWKEDVEEVAKKWDAINESDSWTEDWVLDKLLKEGLDSLREIYFNLWD